MYFLKTVLLLRVIQNKSLSTYAKNTFDKFINKLFIRPFWSAIMTHCWSRSKQLKDSNLFYFRLVILFKKKDFLTNLYFHLIYPQLSTRNKPKGTYFNLVGCGVFKVPTPWSSTNKRWNLYFIRLYPTSVDKGSIRIKCSVEKNDFSKNCL